MSVDPSPSMLEKIFGKRKKNIELPNESGKVDPRTKKVNIWDSLKEAEKGLKALGKIK